MDDLFLMFFVPKLPVTKGEFIEISSYRLFLVRFLTVLSCVKINIRYLVECAFFVKLKSIV